MEARSQYISATVDSKQFEHGCSNIHLSLLSSWMTVTFQLSGLYYRHHHAVHAASQAYETLPKQRVGTISRIATSEHIIPF